MLVVRPVKAHVSEIVEIRWTDDKGNTIIDRRTAPHLETFKARVAERVDDERQSER